MTEQEILIEKYLEGTLTSAEEQDFDDLMINDPKFNEKVSFHLLLRASLRQKDKLEFKQKLSTLEEGISKAGTRRFWIGIAASFIGLILLGMWWFLVPMKTQELFQTYYQPQRNIHEPLTRNLEAKSQNYEAFLAYENEEWEIALSLFQSLTPNSTEQYIQLYLGNCQLQLGQYQEAIVSFGKLKQSEDRELRNRGTWYLALAYLAAGNKKEAKTQLQNHVEVNGAFSDQAKEILNKLN